MSSEQETGTDRFDGYSEEMGAPSPAPSGRWYDQYLGRIMANGRSIVLYGGLIVSYLVCIFAFDEAVAFFGEWWPLILGPILGWGFAQWTVENLFRPSGRYVTLLDVDNHTFRVLFIPDRVYAEFNQSGNNVVYHTLSGFPLYLARNLDPDRGVIDYGWVHELNPIEVMTREDAFVKWDDTLSEVLEENLELMSHPHIIGLGYARKSVRDNLDGLAEVMGFKDMDFGKHGVAGRRNPGTTPSDVPPEGYPDGYADGFPAEDMGGGAE